MPHLRYSTPSQAIYLSKKWCAQGASGSIDEIEKFVDAHLSEDLSVERLCSEFAVSRSRLYDYVGQSISGGIASFVKQKRLLAAKKLVEQTDLPLAEIAYKTGFADYGYFLRVFKRQFGISPGNVRKTLK